MEATASPELPRARPGGAVTGVRLVVVVVGADVLVVVDAVVDVRCVGDGLASAALPEPDEQAGRTTAAAVAATTPATNCHLPAVIRMQFSRRASCPSLDGQVCGMVPSNP